MKMVKMMDRFSWHFPIKEIKKVNVVEAYIPIKITHNFTNVKFGSYQMKSKSEITLFTFNRDNQKCLYWTRNFLLHSFDDLPAVYEYNGDTKRYQYYWYKNGIHHRSRGPAHTIAFGNSMFSNFYINGRQVTKEFVQWAKENDIEAFKMTPEDQAYAAMKWD